MDHHAVRIIVARRRPMKPCRVFSIPIIVDITSSRISPVHH
jgi:hypothetical protein